MRTRLGSYGRAGRDFILCVSNVAEQFHFIEQSLVRFDSEQHGSATPVLRENHWLIGHADLFNELRRRTTEIGQRTDVPRHTNLSDRFLRDLHVRAYCHTSGIRYGRKSWPIGHVVRGDEG